jgi:hypothetical protein
MKLNREAPMATEITLRRVDLQALTSSPECVAWRRISLGTVQHPGLPVRRYLAGGLKLTAEQRAPIAAKVAELAAISNPMTARTTARRG